MLANLKSRPTADLVVIFLAAIVGFYIVFALIATVVIEIVQPDLELLPLFTRIGQIVSSILAAVVGYLGGRGVGASEARKETPPRQESSDDRTV